MEITQISNNKILFMGLSFLGFLMMLPILFALIKENRIKRAETNLLIYIVSCHTVVCFLSFMAWSLVGQSELGKLIMVLDTVALSFSIIGLFFFMRYEIFLLQKRTFISDWVVYFVAFVCVIPIVIMILNVALPTPILYGYDENGNIYYCSLYGLPYVFPFILMIFGAVLTWSCKEVTSNSEVLTLLSYFIFPVIGAIFDVMIDGAFVYPMSSLMILMLYANVHTNAIRNEVTKENELTQSRAKLMISQIQPHFMYNSLNTIYYLIEQDPEQAQEAVATFSDYLRQNVNSLRNDAPVKFAEEIEHTKAYLSLEKLRFGDLLDVEFEIQSDSFVIPALTIQPLVENAVKHGINQREEGGKVVIRSEERDEEFIIWIIDNGVGFDSGKPGDRNTHSHVGIQNVRSRLETMIGGALYVESVPGQGTVCTVVVPKETQPRT